MASICSPAAEESASSDEAIRASLKPSRWYEGPCGWLPNGPEGAYAMPLETMRLYDLGCDSGGVVDHGAHDPFSCSCEPWAGVWGGQAPRDRVAAAPCRVTCCERMTRIGKLGRDRRASVLWRRQILCNDYSHDCRRHVSSALAWCEGGDLICHASSCPSQERAAGGIA